MYMYVRICLFNSHFRYLAICKQTDIHTHASCNAVLLCGACSGSPKLLPLLPLPLLTTTITTITTTTTTTGRHHYLCVALLCNCSQLPVRECTYIGVVTFRGSMRVPPPRVHNSTTTWVDNCVPRNLRICAISRLRCAFSESWDCVPISRLHTIVAWSRGCVTIVAWSWDCATIMRNLRGQLYSCKILCRYTKTTSYCSAQNVLKTFH